MTFVISRYKQWSFQGVKGGHIVSQSLRMGPGGQDHVISGSGVRGFLVVKSLV